MTQDEFITRAKEVWGDRYDLSEAVYVNWRSSVIVTCQKHGRFQANAGLFLQGRGCKNCGIEKNADRCRLTTKQFILKARQVHGWKYDYSLVDYKSGDEKVTIICKEHGSFFQQARVHLMGEGCPECGKKRIADKSRLSRDEYITRANERHGDRYDYSLVEYNGCRAKIKLICREHGEFLTAAYSHLNGRGCPKCNSSTGENEIRRLLLSKGIEFISQYKFGDCKHKKPLPFDFYLPKQNLCIEFQGEQHFSPIETFGGEEKFKLYQLRDQIKRDYCASHGIRLVEIRYDQDIEEELKKQLQL